MWDMILDFFANMTAADAKEAMFDMCRKGFHMASGAVDDSCVSGV
jgi:hypothetical protein